MPTNFGRIDGNPEEAMVPEWMLGEERRKGILMRGRGNRGIKPYMVILEGWSGNADPPTKPQKHWQGTHRGGAEEKGDGSCGGARVLL